MKYILGVNFVMSNAIEAQVLRLIEEIDQDEKNIRSAKELMQYAFTDRAKQQISDEVTMYEEALQRRILILKILKG